MTTLNDFKQLFALQFPLMSRKSFIHCSAQTPTLLVSGWLSLPQSKV